MVRYLLIEGRRRYVAPDYRAVFQRKCEFCDLDFVLEEG
jgi:hypothetical protein